MTPTSWDELGLDHRRTYAIILSTSSIVGSLVAIVSYSYLAELAPVLGVVVGVASAYAMASLPRRSLERSAVIQARESPALAAAASVYLQSTGSKSKTVMMMRSEEPRLAALLSEMRRRTLLGFDPAETFAELGGGVQAESISRILGSVVRAQGERLADEGEELQSMVASALSREETKFPVFLTVAFFLPIMLMLLAAIGHHTDPLAMVGLTFLEIVILDVALTLTSTERGSLGP